MQSFNITLQFTSFLVKFMLKYDKTIDKCNIKVLHLRHQKFFDMLEGWRKVATAVNKLKSKANAEQWLQLKAKQMTTTLHGCNAVGMETILVRQVAPAHAD